MLDHRDGIRVAVEILAAHCQQFALYPVEGRIPHARCRAGLHAHIDLDEVTVDLGDHDLSNQSARHDTCRHDQHRDENSDCDAPVVDRSGEQGPVIVVNQSLQSPLHAALHLEE